MMGGAGGIGDQGGMGGLSGFGGLGSLCAMGGQSGSFQMPGSAAGSTTATNPSAGATGNSRCHWSSWHYLIRWSYTHSLGKPLCRLWRHGRHGRHGGLQPFHDGWLRRTWRHLSRSPGCRTPSQRAFRNSTPIDQGNGVP